MFALFPPPRNRKEFLLGRIDLVNQLRDNSLIVSYAELVLILTSVISACAAFRWPKKNGGDRKRFVELLAVYSPADFHCAYVCVAGLIQKKCLTEAETPWGQSGMSTRIFSDEEIDLDLEEARRTYPRVSLKDLKNNSYAVLIYERLRCAYVHEYAMTEATIEEPVSSIPVRVSYIGRRPFLGEDIQRVAYFDLDYLIKIADYHVNSLPERPEQEPSEWWISQI